LFWIRSAKRSQLTFTEPVKDELGTAFEGSNLVGTTETEALKAQGAGILEIFEDYRGDTYPVV
jgi:hypothetical protein